MNISASILNDYPVSDLPVDELLQEKITEDDHIFVVLDDDPTGVQCVHDVNVYTDWKYETLKEAIGKEKLFFILTNSRAMSVEKTREVHETIAANVSRAAKANDKKYLFISRADSTLRGHYPLETDILSAGLKKDYGHVDGEILIPFFKEGGRYTIDDIHYVRYGDELLPCAETEFAKDKTFGYVHSDLKEYIAEKCEYRVKPEDVLSISLSELRSGDYQQIAERLCEVHDQRRIIVNAIDYVDVKVFCLALYCALKKGKIFNFRSAAALVKCIGGISDKALLEKAEMISEENEKGGLIVIGSHTDKTSRQLAKLKEIKAVDFLEFRCSTLLEGKEAFVEEISRCTETIEEKIAEGKSVAIYTERVVLSLPGDSKEDALARSVMISDGLCQIVNGLKSKPSFVVAKGGITSADIGTKGLGISKALVLGQIEPGIPVWKADPDSRFPDIPYIIFPGNVGEDDTLRKVVSKLL